MEKALQLALVLGVVGFFLESGVKLIQRLVGSFPLIGAVDAKSSQLPVEVSWELIRVELQHVERSLFLAQIAIILEHIPKSK